MWRDEFLKPFAQSVWILISVFVILISILIRAAFVIHERRIKKQIAGSSSFLIAFGGICNQGTIYVRIGRWGHNNNNLVKLPNASLFVLPSFQEVFFHSIWNNYEFHSIGTHLTPNFFSGRCLFITLFLLSIIINNYYTSILLSTLIQTAPQNRIKTITDLENSNLDIGFDNVFHSKVCKSISNL